MRVEVVGAPPPLSPSVRDSVSRLWESAKQANPSITDGRVLCYRDHVILAGAVTVRCFVTRYSRFVARLADPTLEISADPLGVCGAIRDRNGWTLVGRRGKATTEYSGHFEFVPAGSVTPPSARNGRIDFVAQLMLELEEEVGIGREFVTGVTPVALILDPEDRVYNVFCDIGFGGDLRAFERAAGWRGTDEYDDVRAIPWDRVEDFIRNERCVPSMRLGLSLISARNRT